MRHRIIVSLLLFTLFLITSAEGSSEQSKPPGRMMVGFLYFEDKTSDPNMAYWKYSVTGLLKNQIYEVKAIKLLSGNAVQFAFRQLDKKIGDSIDTTQARKMGELIEAQRVVYGSYHYKGNKWQVNAYVLNVASGKVSKKLTSVSANWFDIRDSLNKQILRELNIKPTEEELEKMSHRMTVSSKALELYSRGYALREQGSPESEIEEMYRKAISTDPQFAMAYANLAAVLGTQGKFTEAEEVIHKALKIDSEDPESHNILGVVYLFQGKYPEAQQELQKCLRLDADFSAAASRLGQLSATQSKFDEAIGFYEKSKRIDPFYASNLACLGLAYANLRQREKTIVQLREIERLEPEGPDRTNTDQMLFQIYDLLGDIPLAVKHGDNFLDNARETGAQPKMVKSLAKRIEGLRARLTPVFVDSPMPKVYSEKELKVALGKKLTQEELKLIVNPVVYNEEMKVWAQDITKNTKNDFDKAKTIFDAMIARIQPQQKTVEIGTLTAQQVFENWNDKENSFICQEFTNLYVALARSVKLKAFRVLVQKNYADNLNLHMCAGIFVDGNALLVDPPSRWLGVPHKEYVFLDDLQSIAYHLNQMDVSRCKIAIKLYPDGVISHLNMAGFLTEEGKWEQARIWLDKAMELAPDYWFVYIQLGRFAGHDGDIKAAENFYRKALEINPEFSETHGSLAYVLLKQDRLKEAREELRASLLYQPETQKAEEALRAIAMINEKIGYNSANIDTKITVEQSQYYQPELTSETKKDIEKLKILTVGTEIITIDDIILYSFKQRLKSFAENLTFERYNRQIKPNITARIRNEIFYRQAKQQVGESIYETLDDKVEEAVNKFVAECDNNDTKISKALKQLGLNDLQEYRELQKRAEIEQAYILKLTETYEPISLSQMQKYYEDNQSIFQVDGNLQFSLIDIELKKLKPSQINEGETAKNAAMRIANQLVKRLRDGEDFALLAKKYSHGYRSQHGGTWRSLHLGSLAQPYNLLEEKSAEMNPGEVSGSIEADGHVFIMKLLQLNKGGVKPFKDVQWEIKAAIEERQCDAVLNKLHRRRDKFPGIKEFADLCIKESYFRFTDNGLE